MRGIMSQFVLFIFLTALFWISVTYVSLNMRYCGAKEYFAGIVRQLEDSYFDSAVIRDCVTEAERQGYQLSVRCYGKNDKDARVTMQYEFVFPMTQTKKRYVIDGYAR